ncbi:MAG TPA: hypothetical protein VNM87_03905 [Candidatus Udaeobacter sp.]|nr:hypothetical protein [Candidatus Udaeobacter sp.]
MRNAIRSTLVLIAALGMIGSSARAVTVVIDYEDLTEGMQGDPLTHMGVTYSELNNVSGVFPDGEIFGPQPEDQFVIEDAGLFYGDFPAYGSPVNSLTFGIAFVPGKNLTIGPLATVTMDLANPAIAASLDLGYYENGAWGGIVYHLDALFNGQVVATNNFVISNLGGRDNPAATTMSVSGALFDQLHLYATFGAEYSMPRGMIDDLTLTFDGATPVGESTWGKVKSLYR